MVPSNPWHSLASRYITTGEEKIQEGEKCIATERYVECKLNRDHGFGNEEVFADFGS